MKNLNESHVCLIVLDFMSSFFVNMILVYNRPPQSYSEACTININVLNFVKFHHHVRQGTIEQVQHIVIAVTSNVSKINELKISNEYKSFVWGINRQSGSIVYRSKVVARGFILYKHGPGG